MNIEPSYCPFCGAKTLTSLEPTEIILDNDIWIFFHYKCNTCKDTFEKAYIRSENVIDDNDLYTHWS